MTPTQTASAQARFDKIYESYGAYISSMGRRQINRHKDHDRGYSDDTNKDTKGAADAEVGSPACVVQQFGIWRWSSYEDG
jgi:hypothetical protein